MTERRFDINPGPLKIVPAAQRRPFATAYEIHQTVRCEATTRAGVRCERTKANDSNHYCWQHS